MCFFGKTKLKLGVILNMHIFSLSADKPKAQKCNQKNHDEYAVLQCNPLLLLHSIRSNQLSSATLHMSFFKRPRKSSSKMQSRIHKRCSWGINGGKGSRLSEIVQSDCRPVRHREQSINTSPPITPMPLDQQRLHSKESHAKVQIRIFFFTCPYLAAR